MTIAPFTEAVDVVLFVIVVIFENVFEPVIEFARVVTSCVSRVLAVRELGIE